jgi:hypothetical protein
MRPFLSSSGFSGFDPLDLNLDLVKFETIGRRIDWLPSFTTRRYVPAAKVAQ